jgi:hypothetical protein
LPEALAHSGKLTAGLGAASVDLVLAGLFAMAYQRTHGSEGAGA